MSVLMEIGRIGQNRYGGIFHEEFLPELQGRRSIQVYREMSENDDIIGAILYAIEILCRQAPFHVETVSDSAKDKEAAEFVESCMDDMQDTWTDTISEILSFLTFGWSAHELVYKRRLGHKRDPRMRSKYDDGLIGWRKLPVRAQETLYEWRYDERDNLTGMVQLPPPDFGLIEIPVEKLLLFRTKSRKGNPEGRSILRNAYRDWYFKKHIQEIEGIGIERDLAGFPVLIAPSAEEGGVDIWNPHDPKAAETLARAEALIQNIRRDSLEGLVLPPGWTFQLTSTGGKRQFDTNAVIERYDSRIAMTVLADFVLLGHQNTGSWALSSDKTELFAMAIGTYLDIICEAFSNQAIPRLIDLNGEHFHNISGYPRMTHGDIEKPDLEQLGKFLQSVTGSGLLTPDDDTEDYVRQIAELPERKNDYGAYRKSPVKTDSTDDDDLSDDERIRAAKRRLGRNV